MLLRQNEFFSFKWCLLHRGTKCAKTIEKNRSLAFIDNNDFKAYSTSLLVVNCFINASNWFLWYLLFRCASSQIVTFLSKEHSRVRDSRPYRVGTNSPTYRLLRYGTPPKKNITWMRYSAPRIHCIVRYQKCYMAKIAYFCIFKFKPTILWKNK